MLREAKFTLPDRDNDGVPADLAHKKFRAAMLRLFGGYTATPSFGGWWDAKAGKEVQEPGLTYTVAIPNDPASWQLFEVAALTAGAAAGQSAVYMVGPDGTARVVSLKQEATP